MVAQVIQETRWTKVGIVCPHCGNNGTRRGKWVRYSYTPFKVAEDVVRLFAFVAQIVDGDLVLTADVDTDEVDWESGNKIRIVCMQCFAEFPIPEKASVDFDALS